MARRSETERGLEPVRSRLCTIVLAAKWPAIAIWKITTNLLRPIALMIVTTMTIMTTTPEKRERKAQIMERLRSSMAAIQNDPRFDWTREPSQATCAAADTLMKAVQKFIDGKLGEGEIKMLYKSYVNLYAR